MLVLMFVPAQEYQKKIEKVEFSDDSAEDSDSSSSSSGSSSSEEDTDESDSSEMPELIDSSSESDPSSETTTSSSSEDSSGTDSDRPGATPGPVLKFKAKKRAKEGSVPKCMGEHNLLTHFPKSDDCDICNARKG